MRVAVARGITFDLWAALRSAAAGTVAASPAAFAIGVRAAPTCGVSEPLVPQFSQHPLPPIYGTAPSMYIPVHSKAETGTEGGSVWRSGVTASLPQVYAALLREPRRTPA